MDSENEETEDIHNLVGWRTVLITGLKPEEYMLALLHIQAVSLPIIQDEAPFNSITGTMGLNIPPEEIKQTIMLLTNVWNGPG